MNKRLMILGSNEPLLARACELGYEVHCFGLTSPPSNFYSGKKVYFHRQNILEYNNLWQECQKLKPVGVVSVCSELAMHPMHFLLRKMGIPCNSYETEKITTNKYLMRKTLESAGLDSPKFTLVTSSTVIDELSITLRDFVFPLIIKPIDSSASRGVMKINGFSELAKSIQYSLKWSNEKKCILEEFVEGQEYSGESIAYGGKYKLLAITEKTTTGAPYFVEKAHRQPANLSPVMNNKIEEVLYKAFSALNIEYGAIHPEFRITSDGRIIFMEIATRMGGGHIGTELTPLSSGYDFLGMVINICCGQQPDFTKNHTPKAVEIHYFISKDDIQYFEEIKKNKDYSIYYSSDISQIPSKEVKNNIERLGYYIVTSEINNQQ